MAMNVMTYLWNKNGKPKRIIDKLAMGMNKIGLYKARDYWTIEEVDSKEVVGAFYTIEGSNLVTSFLSWATDCRGKDVTHSTVNADRTGRIVDVNKGS